ncbi:MAG: glycyl radical protein [Spirochaetales bacterium]|nr:glycyl radical protein [Spirochaetales bacterium]MCF7939008.1 glycyl radical protein [Spirochaetales bacterium]
MSSTVVAENEIHWRTKQLNNEILAVNPEMCVERARYVTESYKETESEPMVIRRAKAIAKVLEKMTIFIQRDQLIAGVQASSLRASPLFPETEAGYLESEIDLFSKREQDRLQIKPEVRKELLEDILPYWKGKGIKETALSAMPEHVREKVELEDQIFSVGIHLTGSIGHILADYDKVLDKGLVQIRKENEAKRDSLDLADPDEGKKYNFYQAEIILCDAIIGWARRYAEEAERLAAEETDPRWKSELETMAAACRRVPAYPAEGFREALQSFWFTHLLLYIEQNGLAVSPGRFDQYMFPYYKKSIEDGSISREEAQELLECLWIKFTEIMRAYDYESAKNFAGFSISENIVLGGVDEDGRDATNDLSYMCLEAEAHTKLSQPNLSVRVHNKTPDRFLMRAAEISATGRTKPEFFNDGVGIPTLLSTGVSLEDARDYGISGCVEAVPPHANGMTNAAMSNIAKALELALNNGVSRLSGKQIGPKTGDPGSFTDIEDVILAFREQVKAYVRDMVIALNEIERTHARLFPLPYFSLVMDDCFEQGLDITEGGARYNYTGPQAVGLGDVADSLAALKKIVFEEKKYSMKQILDALEKDFEGEEVLHQILSNKVPKWGNDDDYVDELAVEVVDIFCDEVSQYRNTRKGIYRPGVYSVSANVPLGVHVGALPNGKKARQPLADGVAPVHGVELSGPTAVVKSVSKLNHEKITNGTILNQKFTPKVLEGERGKRGLANLIRSYFDLGGWHIQFNVVSADTLRAAQRDPEKHKGLIIRVAGYSAFFVELDTAVQDDIIDRTEAETI